MSTDIENYLRQEKIKNIYKKMLFEEKLRVIKAGGLIAWDDYSDEEVLVILRAIMGEEYILGYINPEK